MIGFKKAVIFSFVGHLAAFGVFSFSFADRAAIGGHTAIYFMGGILNNRDLKPSPGQAMGRAAGTVIRELFGRGKAFLPKRQLQVPSDFLELGYIKPQVGPLARGEKTWPMPIRISAAQPFVIKTPPVFFYPQLPYNFPLYFKDRQVAHIELAFQVASQDSKGSLLVKRKISSGSLETDLLSMRYISRYLSLQQGAFAPGQWQAVKIELSAPGENNSVK